jgi:hypothetical protein
MTYHLQSLTRHLWEVLTFYPRRSPNSQTEELDGEYLRTISVQGREYQKYSIDNRISFEPVDDVRNLLPVHCFKSHLEGP